MIQGIYTAAGSMIMRQVQQDIIANNLANLNTTGYKRDRIVFRQILDAAALLEGTLKAAPVDDVITDFDQGRLQKTGNQLDFAIKGEGFFVVTDGNQRFLTRNGHFQINEDGELVTPTGLQVLGENGPIVLSSEDFSVNVNGEILVEGRVQDRFFTAMVQNPSQELQRVGNNLFQFIMPNMQPVQGDAEILQGYVESSNVNVVEEMVSMIMVFRDFEFNQRTIQTQDDTLRRAVNDLGKL